MKEFTGPSNVPLVSNYFNRYASTGTTDSSVVQIYIQRKHSYQLKTIKKEKWIKL